MSAGNKDTVLTIVDKATGMVHLVPCRKNIMAVATAKLLWQNVVKLHGIPRAIFSDRGPQFTENSWRELWRLIGTKLKFSSAYHPQTQGVVERMNAVVGQTLRCLIHNSNDMKTWEILLPTVELVINSLPNSSTGFIPFYLNDGYKPVTLIELLYHGFIYAHVPMSCLARTSALDVAVDRSGILCHNFMLTVYNLW